MNKYETTDLALATTLLVYYPIIELRRIDGKRVAFVFNDSDKLQKTIQEYWNGTLRENPTVLFNAMRTLKTRLYSMF
jgi:hypothetical protein